MKTESTSIPIQQTGFFTKTVTDYLNNAVALQPFYQYPVSLEGIQSAIQARQQFAQQRTVLVHALQQQYTGTSTTETVQQNIVSLADENTFTITTAHQPNILTGPLYFIYKILHTIQLAAYLTKQLPAYRFIPVYYMGSEDADLDELGSITVKGKKHTWHTRQTGSVGRMKTDQALLQLIDDIHGQTGIEPFGQEIISIFKSCYQDGVSIQQATLELVNTLFGEWGLVTIIPDNGALKQLFIPVVEKELTQQFSHAAVSETLSELAKTYKPQAGGRELNLFYLVDDKRERIEKNGSKFFVKSLHLEWDETAILKELYVYPERFSANVILRGVFQETILPNIAFIGGGGELAYWLELKKVFREAAVPYPVLILRNSFLLITKLQIQKIQNLGFTVEDFFRDELSLMNELVKKSTQHQISLEKEIAASNNFFNEIKYVAGEVDASLQQHVDALNARNHKWLTELEKKIARAERKKFDIQQRQVQQLKAALFPGNSLQERVENISGFYATYGPSLLHELLAHSNNLEQQFIILTIFSGQE